MSADHAIHGFTFADTTDGLHTLLRLDYLDGRALAVALRTERLAAFDKLLTDAITRCAVARGVSSGAPLAPLSDAPYGSGPARVGAPTRWDAYAIDHVEIATDGDGRGLAIAFRRASDQLRIVAAMSTEAAEELLDQARRRLAIN